MPYCGGAWLDDDVWAAAGSILTPNSVSSEPAAAQSSAMRWSGLSAVSPGSRIAMMRRAFQPMGEIALRHPVPPADLKPLVQVELIDLQHCGGRRKDAEIQELVGDQAKLTDLATGCRFGAPAIRSRC